VAGCSWIDGAATPVSEATTDDAGLLYGWRKSTMWGKIGPRL
jgi:hypothetical protein